MAAAAFKACTSGSPTCMGRLSNLGVRPSNAAKRAPKPEVPLLPWAKTRLPGSRTEVSETRTYWGVLWFASRLCARFCGSRRGRRASKGRAAAEQSRVGSAGEEQKVCQELRTGQTRNLATASSRSCHAGSSNSSETVIGFAPTVGRKVVPFCGQSARCR